MTIRFTQLELRRVRLPFRVAFCHAQAERREAEAIVLALATDRGAVGYGQCLPRTYLTGEDMDEAWDAIASHWWPRLKRLAIEEGADVRPALSVLRPLYEEADASGRLAGYAAVDVAAVDACARAGGVPGDRLFGQTPRAEPLTAALGEASVGRTAWLARVLRWLGFHQFKLKTGGACDLERLAAVRRAVGPASDLRVDANGAWTEDVCADLADRLRACGVSSIEQPVGLAGGRSAIPASERAHVAGALLRVQKATGLPVMADESLCSRADARMLLGDRVEDRVLLWNVRLAKVGGFSGARELIQLADAHGVGVQLGVLVGETSILAAAHRALFGLTECTHVEYGFPRFLLKPDPFAGDPGGWCGRGRPLAGRTGLGVRPRKRALERLTLQREVLA